MKMKSIITLLGAFAWVCVASAWTHSPSSKTVAASGETFTLTVSGTENYNWYAGAVNADWITVTRTSAKTFTVTVAKNTSETERSANVAINAFRADAASNNQSSWVSLQNCGITQAGNKIIVTPTTVSFECAGGSRQISVTCGGTWTVSESLDWLTSNVSGGSGNDTVTLTASVNTGIVPRSGTVTIAGKSISIEQKGSSDYSYITYGNLKEATHANPAYYKHGDEVTFTNPSEVDGYVFTGWVPTGIDASTTGDVYVVATWSRTNACAITNIIACQRWPWNGKVDIRYEVVGNLQKEAARCGYTLSPIFSATNTENGAYYRAKSIDGDFSLEEGTHAVVWDMEADGISIQSSNVLFSVSCVTNVHPYCVIDISGGVATNEFAISYLDEIPGGMWSDEYKVSKIVLRRVDKTDLDAWFIRHGGTSTNRQSYYIGVFEFTCGQARKLGESLAWQMVDYWDDLIGYTDDWSQLRGAEPISNDVAEASLLSKLHTKTGLHMDFPTPRQWLAAYEAGITYFDYYWEKIPNADPSDYAWYVSNSGYDRHAVGQKLPNQWGLYDMSGNTAEFVLSYALDGNGDKRYELMGGSYYDTLDSGKLGKRAIDYSWSYGGLRLTWTVDDGAMSEISFSDRSDPIVVDTAGIARGPIIKPSIIDSQMILLSFEWKNDWEIHYTADGTDPLVTSPVCTNGMPLDIRGAKTIKARAFGPNNATSEISTYEIAAPNAPTISPVDGTIIGSSVSVNISSDTPNATIYCTTDGTEPTTSSTVYKRFKASTKMTVKAIAVVDGMAWSETTIARYALGQCADPIITPTDGTIFDSSKYQVSIAKNGEKGVLRYTTDGSEPTESSPIYTAPFTISATTTIKAKTFDTEYFDSAVVSATLTRQWTKVATPVIHASETFSGTKQTVSLTCETEDAVIRYTTDGSEPNSHSKKYTAAFDVTGTAVVKAIAFKTDCTASDVATLEITKQWGIGDALNDSDRQFATDAETGWVRDTAVSHDGSESVKSGNIEDSSTTGIYSESILSTTVEGKGAVSFWWKASCEEDDDFEWDHGEFRVDGTVVTNINGSAGWINISHEITSSGSHTLSWVYCKDDFGFEEDDCIWVDEFGWQVNDPIPELGDNPTPQQVASALEGSTDSRLAQNITDGAGYEKYRVWAGKVKASANGDPIGAEAVKSSSHAWLSFALDSATLIETAPDEDDVQIESFAPSGTEGRFDFTVGIENVAVGSEATVENLKTVFGLEGGSSLTNMSSSNVELTFGTPENGKVKFSAGPKDTTQSTFFMKVRMTP